MEKGNQILGIVRFSYLAAGGFKLSKQPIQDQIDIIYSPERLDRRFKLFEQLTLPSIIRQTDKDFTLAILISDSLPQSYKNRLSDLVALVPNVTIIAQPILYQIDAIRNCIGAVTAPTANTITGFRLDDDDMIEKDYVARLRQRAIPAFELFGRHRPVVISNNRGFYLDISDSGNIIFDARERTPLGIGLAMVTRVGDNRNIFSRNHRALAGYFPVVSDAQEPSWLRTVHRDNDSRPIIPRERDSMAKPEVAHALLEKFGVSWDDLMALKFGGSDRNLRPLPKP